MLTNTK